ncbi:FlxA-like family protein [Spirosoma validum]|uniref:FlxA-like family protein n=1 Tax=Spirosoma validum TaxID=2771355 RepID=A0A927AZ95_9BACT|nr:FlxA-like family protein [Spirosoma validum]MBD2752599.1 FlxA-like family protein [Spirosoma validum]
MKKKIRQFLIEPLQAQIQEVQTQIREVQVQLNQTKEDNAATKLVMGAVLAKLAKQATSLKEAEFKLFSQFGDDGIIQYLISYVKPRVDTFVEFGVEDYEEANTRFLLMNNNWKGLIIDGSPNFIDHIKTRSFFWRYSLNAITSFVTAENINQLLASNGIVGQIGLLSIDIDGNDYWVWKAITVVEADIVVIEYNSLFGSKRSISIPYQPDFAREQAHYSYLYFGASLPALYDLALDKGYAFVGCNQAGNNAYFVKEEKLNGLTALSIEEGYVYSRFREGRNQAGIMSFLDGVDREAIIEGLPVINTKTNTEEYL